MSIIVPPPIQVLLRRGMIFSLLLFVAIGAAIPMSAKDTGAKKADSSEGDGQQSSRGDDLSSRVARLETLCGAAQRPEAPDQRSQFLAQFYTAEYSAIMGRISSWASLQYALFPILLAGLAILSKMDELTVRSRLWIATGGFLVGYLAYQGTMLDELQNVLLIERYLRPLASRLVGTDQFWIHERIYRQSYPTNIFYWKYLPPLICLSALTGVVLYISRRYGFGRKDYAFTILALLALAGVLNLTIEGSHLEAQIITACKRSKLLVDPVQVHPTISGRSVR